MGEDFNSPMSGHMRDNRIGLDNIYLGPSLYGDLWESLQKLMNFNYTMVKLLMTRKYVDTIVQVYSIDGSWGSMNDDGSWNGVVRIFMLGSEFEIQFRLE